MDAPIVCVVFDFDGTLVDSNRIKHDVFFQLAELQVGGRDAMEEVYARVKGSRYEIWRAWGEKIGANASLVDEMVTKYNAITEIAVVNAPEMPGAVALLEELRLEKGLKLLVSSATPRDNLVPIIKARGWLGYFDGIYGQPETKKDILIRYAVPLAGAAARVAVVGDGGDDRESARFIGCRFFPVGEEAGSFSSSNGQIYRLPELVRLLGRQANLKKVSWL